MIVHIFICKIRYLRLECILIIAWHKKGRDDRVRTQSIQETNCIHYLRICYDNEHTNNQLTIGLIAQLVKHCRDIVALMGSNPVQVCVCVCVCVCVFFFQDLIFAKENQIHVMQWLKEFKVISSNCSFLVSFIGSKDVVNGVVFRNTKPRNEPRNFCLLQRLCQVVKTSLL